MNPPLWDRLWTLYEEGKLLSVAIYYFFVTVGDTIFLDNAPLELLRIKDLRAKAFSRFWLAVAPPPVPTESPANDTESSFVNLRGYLSAASGTVLDVGPGTGTFISCLNASSIATVYGAEPAIDLHPALKASAGFAGLGDKYQVLSCGGERDSLLPALEKAGLLKNAGSGVKEEAIFDTIICVRVLCSVPNLEASISTLYSLLRPGGRMIICEHVINNWRSSKGSILGRAFQALLMLLGWPFFIGDCRLDRDTVTLLSQVGDANGGWETVELNKEREWSALPFVTGIFVKRDTGEM